MAWPKTVPHFTGDMIVTDQFQLGERRCLIGWLYETLGVSFSKQENVAEYRQAFEAAAKQLKIEGDPYWGLIHWAKAHTPTGVARALNRVFQELGYKHWA